MRATATVDAWVNVDGRVAVRNMWSTFGDDYFEVGAGSLQSVDGWTKHALEVPIPERAYRPGDVIKFTRAGIERLRTELALRAIDETLIRIASAWKSPRDGTHYGSDITIRKYEHTYLYNILHDDLIVDDDD